MLRRIFLVILVLLVLLVGAALALPVIYKDEIVGLIQKEANKNLRAQLAFDKDVSLSLFRDFPHLSLRLNKLSLVNQAPFEGDTLFAVDQFDVVVDVMSVLRGDAIEVLRVAAEQPRVNVQVNAQGQANYDIAKASEEPAQETPADTAAGGNFQVKLQEYAIRDAYIRYADATLPMEVTLKSLTHTGTGDFSLQQFVLSTQTQIQALDLTYDGVRYFKQVETALEADLDMDMEQMRFAFKENRLSLNNLVLAFDGFVAMPGEDIEMDMRFETQRNRFQDIFTLIPAVYKSDMAGLEASGELSLKGRVQGVYAEQPASLPGFEVSLQAQDGRFHYQDMPTTLSKVQVDLSVRNESGELNHTVVEMPRMYMEVNGQPVEARLLLRTPTTDPFIDAALVGGFDLRAFRDLIPNEDLGQVAGTFKADVAMKGNMSTLESGRYEAFDAKGQFQLANFSYADAGFPEPLQIPNMELLISPQVFDLKAFKMNIGRSDLSATGQLSNFLPYYLDSQVLVGQLNVNSEYFDLNPFMEEEEEAAPQSEQSAEIDTALTAPTVPKNIDFTMDARMAEVVYEKLRMKDVAGQVLVEDGAVQFNKLRAGLLRGQMRASGQYNTRNPERPFMDMQVQANAIEPQTAHQSLSMVREYIPMAKQIGGSERQTRFNLDFNLRTDIRQNLDPVLSSIDSKGEFIGRDVLIEGNQTLKKIADRLKRDDLERLDLGRLAAAFEIRNGRFYLEPTDFRAGNVRGTLAGSNGLDQSLDYELTLNLPSQGVQQVAQSLMADFLGDQAEQARLPNRITVAMGIGGTTDDPQITSLKLGADTREATQGARQQLKQKLQQEKEELEQKAREEAEKRRRELEEKKKEAEEKARKEAQKAKEDAKKKAKEKSKEAKDKAKDKAKEKLDDLF